MKQIWLLTKVRLSALFSSTVSNGRGKGKTAKPRSKAMVAFLLLALGIAFLSIALMMFSLAYALGDLSFNVIQKPWFFYAMMHLVSFVLMIFTGAFAAKSQIFDAKDNELLLAMPISPKNILLARMLCLYITDIAFELLVLVPTAIVAILMQGFSVVWLLLFTVSMLLTPMLALTVACLLGWVLAWVSSKFKNKTWIQALIALAFFGGYMYFVGNADVWLEQFLQYGNQIADNVQMIAYPFYLVGLACGEGRILPFLLYLAMMVIPMILCVAILSRQFVAIATTKSGGKKAVFHNEQLATGSVASPLMAFTKKEIKHFFSCASYMINAGVALIMEIFAGVMLLIKGGSLVATLEGVSSAVPELAGLPGLMALGIPLFVLSMNLISAPSVSLEGGQLWIALTLPVKDSIPLHAKTLSHVLLSALPTLFYSVCAIIVLPMSVPMMIYVVVLPQLFNCLVALIGTLINLRFPKFDWLDETVAVKQSIAVLITMLLTMLSALVFGGGIVALGLLLPDYLAVLPPAILMGGLVALLYLVEDTKGGQMFMRLGNR